jgi:hypothetical protein
MLGLRGFKELHLPREMDGYLNLIPIDFLLNQFIALLRRGEGNRSGFEIVHCTGEEVSASAVGKAAEIATGIRVSFDGARSAIDYLFAERIEANRIFAAHRFRFEQKNLCNILGSAHGSSCELSHQSLVNLISVYLHRLGQEKVELRFSPLLRPFLPLLSQDSPRLAPALAGWVTRHRWAA